MSQTKRISRQTRTGIHKAETARIEPSFAERARAARVEAVRGVINDPAFNLDAAFARAMQILLNRS